MSEITTTETGAAAPAGWAGILDPGERILWQGRPDGRFHFRLVNLVTVVFGIFFSGFATFWMVMAAQAPGPFWMFGLIFFFAGIAIVVQAIFGDTLKRRFTWYTLTDRRAFIATDMPLRGRSLRSYPIDADTVIDYRAGTPATINFAHEYRQGKNSSYRVEIGFERIAEGERVMGLMRAVQRGAAEAGEA